MQHFQMGQPGCAAAWVRDAVFVVVAADPEGV